eukprot:6492189-Amphidinium_carterae.3
MKGKGHQRKQDKFKDNCLSGLSCCKGIGIWLLGFSVKLSTCQASNEYYTDCTMVRALMNVNLEWHMQIYTLVESARSIPQMDASIVCVRLHTPSSIHLWPVVQVRVSKKRRVTRKLAADGDMAAGPSESATVLADEMNDDDHHDDHDADEAASDGEDWFEDEEDEENDATVNGDLLDRALVLQQEQDMLAERPQPEAKPAKDSSRVDTHHADNRPVVQLARGSVGAADAAVTLESGRLAFYSKKNLFQATCYCHQRCTLSRSSKPGAIQRGGASVGRPLGLMTAWLEAASEYPDKTSHHAALEALTTDAESRRAARDALIQVEGGLELMSQERAKVDDAEPDEPYVVK